MHEKRSMKQRGEDAAAAYLERVGTCVIERAWTCDAGRIDIIAWDGDELVLVDVRTRQRTTAPPSPVSPAVERRIRRLAQRYQEQADLVGRPWRFDRIELLVISDDRALLRHHRAAFSADSL